MTDKNVVDLTSMSLYLPVEGFFQHRFLLLFTSPVCSSRYQTAVPITPQRPLTALLIISEIGAVPPPHTIPTGTTIRPTMPSAEARPGGLPARPNHATNDPSTPTTPSMSSTSHGLFFKDLDREFEVFRFT